MFHVKHLIGKKKTTSKCSLFIYSALFEPKNHRVYIFIKRLFHIQPCRFSCAFTIS